MSRDMRREKRELRRRILRIRDGLGEAEREAKSRAIAERLAGLPEYRGARTVLFFISFRSEVRTEGAVRRALAEGRRAVVPISDTANRALLPSELFDYDEDLVPGAYGIPEPPPDRRRPVHPDEIDLVLMPGSVFDRTCNRIGYGGGYYDGFLAGLTRPVPRVAVAFDLQVVDRVPMEEHDLPVDAVVTETRTLRRSDADF